MRTLSYDKVKKFYDRFGARQDRSTLYERLPIELLIKNSEFTIGFKEESNLIHFNPFTLPLAVSKDLVITDQSLTAPSS